MPTIRKTTPGQTHIHTHGTVAGGETIDVDAETAAYLVEESGGYEYVHEPKAVDETESSSGGGQNADGSSDGEPESVSDAETCDAVKSDGEVCGRELPCPYHSDGEGED